jgi:hypothetical protein
VRREDPETQANLKDKNKRNENCPQQSLGYLAPVEYNEKGFTKIHSPLLHCGQPAHFIESPQYM